MPLNTPIRMRSWGDGRAQLTLCRRDTMGPVTIRAVFVFEGNDVSAYPSVASAERDAETFDLRTWWFSLMMELCCPLRQSATPSTLLPPATDDPLCVNLQ
jgi:hypothetical protein